MIALVDETGTPAARFDYTPYGELARAEAWSSGGGGGGGGGGGVPGAAALALASRVGHQGLFFDNLETPWAEEQLALGGQVLLLGALVEVYSGVLEYAADSTIDWWTPPTDDPCSCAYNVVAK